MAMHSHTQVSRGSMKENTPGFWRSGFLIMMEMPVFMKGLVKSTTRSRSWVIVSGATAMSRSCQDMFRFSVSVFSVSVFSVSVFQCSVFQCSVFHVQCFRFNVSGSVFQVQCFSVQCFMFRFSVSTETIRTTRHREPRTAASTFIQLLGSELIV